MILSGNITTGGVDLFIGYIKVCVFATITIWSFRKRSELITYIIVIILLNAANGAFALYEQLLGGSSGAMFRSSGFQQNSNVLANILATTMPFAYYFFIHGKNKPLKLLVLMSSVCIVFGVFCTVSRAGLLGLIFTTACFFIKNIKRIIVIFLIGIFIFISFSFVEDLYKQRKSTETTASGKVTVDSSTQKRIGVSILGLQLWLEHPIFGIGYNNFTTAASEKLGGQRQKVVIHDAFIQILCETGILGFVTCIYIFIQSLQLVASLKKRGDFYGEIAGYFQINLLCWVILLLFSTTLIAPMLWIALSLPFILDNISKLEDNMSRLESTMIEVR